MRRKPYSVVLFDEIEKAHPDVFNTLLQILDDGRLTDAQGHRVDFRNTVIIMTSNIGSVHLLEGITSSGEIPEDVRGRVMGDLRGHFRPEFLNRVDEIVVFPPLTKEQIVAMVDNMVAAVDIRLKDRDMAIELTQNAKDLLATRGFDPVLGARPLRRTVQREIEDTLAEKMLYGEVRPGQIILVDVEGEGAEAVFTFRGEQKSELPDLPPIEEPAGTGEVE